MRYICLWVCSVVVSSFSYSPLHAECLQSPDCADLGYTKSEADCPLWHLKCPWDANKVFCTAGNGACENIGKKRCNNLCVPADGCCADDDCGSGFLCDLKTRMCKQVCAPGYFYYSDLTCSADLIEGKALIGVVGSVSNRGMDGLTIALNHTALSWQKNLVDLPCIPNISGAVAAALPSLNADYAGKNYTACMMEQTAIYGTGYFPAGENCANLSIEGVSGWYLPASAELYEAMIANRTEINASLSQITGAAVIPAKGANLAYWSSTERSSNAAWNWTFYDDAWGWCQKTYVKDSYVTHCARCVLAF